MRRLQGRSFTAGLFSLCFEVFFGAHGVAAAESKFAILSFSYKVSCPNLSESAFPGIPGKVILYNDNKTVKRIIRFDLFKYNTSAEVLVPQDASFEIKFSKSKNCTLDSFSHEITHEQNLALTHAPFMVIRKDLYQRRDRDVPIAITYSILHPETNITRIVYTLFFSNESDYGWFATSKAKSAGVYGRESDIEWIYSVDLDANGNKIESRYQGGVFQGLGHATYYFNGNYFPQTQHPILYNIAKHNVFHQSPDGVQQNRTLEGYHLVPREEIKTGEAREWWMWRNPWSFDVTDRELKRSKTLLAPASSFLYALIRKANFFGNLIASFIKPGSSEALYAGYGSGTIQKLGEDLWHEESFTAIDVGEDFLTQANSHGEFYIEAWKNRRTLSLEDTKVRFFKLERDLEMGFKPVEISHEFQCKVAAGVSCTR